jgi:chemotaxis protein MotA
MDLITIIGILVGFGGIVGGFLMEGGNLASLFEPSAMVIIFAGSLGATLISFTMRHINGLPAAMKHAFMEQPLDREGMLRQIVSLARQARKSGILTLEAEAKNIENAFLRNAIQMVVDGTPAELVQEILETEISAMSTRHKIAEEFFNAWGGYSPTLGVIGTVMGLVHMLENLSDPGGMGPAIATAFLATLWGVVIANLLFLPLAGKLKVRSQEERDTYTMAIEGILALQAGENPRVVGMKMRAFLSPIARAKLDAEG